MSCHLHWNDCDDTCEICLRSRQEDEGEYERLKAQKDRMTAEQESALIDSLRSSNARLREALVEIRDNPNCHREISDDALRRFPDVTYHIIMEARRQSDKAAKALEGK